MKKIISVFLCLALILSFAGCGVNENDVVSDILTPNETITSSSAEKTDNKKDKNDSVAPLSDLTVKLFSYYTGKFDEMRFGDYTKSKIVPTDKGTAFTFIVCSPDGATLSNIENVTVKSASGGAVNFTTKSFMLNNKKAMVVFAKTEGEHKYTEYALYLKTYSGEDKLIPISDDKDKTYINIIQSPANNATFGDIVKAKDKYYFIIQNGQLNSSTYAKDNSNILELTTATILVPLENTFKHVFTTEDFATKFYDSNKLGDYGITPQISVNSSDIMSTYLDDNYSDLFVETINCVFSYSYADNKNDAISKRDYVVKNTYIKATFDENFILTP